MFRLIKQAFAALLRFSESLATCCIYFNNQSCMTRPTLIALNADEHNQGQWNYPFMVSLGRCNKSFNTLGKFK